VTGMERVHIVERGPNILIAKVLRVGLVASVAVLLVGVILAAAGRGTPVPNPISLSDMPRTLWHVEAGGVFSLGLLILLLTPAARVLALAVVFSRQRLWVFLGCSLLVLAVLVLSGVLGLRGG
jgi:uncharacterized membrane protein